MNAQLRDLAHDMGAFLNRYRAVLPSAAMADSYALHNRLNALAWNDAALATPKEAGDAVATVTVNSGFVVGEHQVEFDPAFDEFLNQQPNGYTAKLYAAPQADQQGDADKVIRRLWSYMGPKTPPCCEGCNAEWDMAIAEMKRYLGSDAYPAAEPSDQQGASEYAAMRAAWDKVGNRKWHEQECSPGPASEWFQLGWEASRDYRAASKDRQGASLEGDAVEAAAIMLWHRFAPDHHIEWEHESHKAEYRDAAAHVLGVTQVKEIP